MNLPSGKLPSRSSTPIQKSQVARVQPAPLAQAVADPMLGKVAILAAFAQDAGENCARFLRILARPVRGAVLTARRSGCAASGCASTKSRRRTTKPPASSPSTSVSPKTLRTPPFVGRRAIEGRLPVAERRDIDLSRAQHLFELRPRHDDEIGGIRAAGRRREAPRARYNRDGRRAC